MACYICIYQRITKICTIADHLLHRSIIENPFITIITSLCSLSQWLKLANMSNLVDLSSDLSLVYETNYESGKYSDISINVRKEPNKKIFLAHTLVLCARSKYLENEIMESNEDQKTVIVLEDVTPDVFEVLIR